MRVNAGNTTAKPSVRTSRKRVLTSLLDFIAAQRIRPDTPRYVKAR